METTASSQLKSLCDVFVTEWNHIETNFIQCNGYSVAIPLYHPEMEKVMESFKVLGFNAEIGACRWADNNEICLMLSWRNMCDAERQQLAEALNHVFLCDNPMTRSRFDSLKYKQPWQKIIRCCTILGKEIRLCNCDFANNCQHTKTCLPPVCSHA